MSTTSDGALRRLVIVESPAKAKTIRGYLGDGYDVEASVGHIRDLPKSAADIPAKYKKEKWARLGVDIDHGFEPLYIVSPEKKGKVSELKRLLANADELLLATDEDREGEAIAWHLLQVLKPKVPVRRMVFHEITKDAIRAAAQSPRELDQRLVDAQEARRIIDRLYGYEVSPVLWKKVTTGLSAGRVQSVATRLVVERERQRMAFVAASYWDIGGTFDPSRFTATLVAVDSRRVARGSDFDDRGQLKRDDVVVLDEQAATSLASALEGVDLTVRSVEEKPYRRSPAAPFITSTLQQEASRKLRMTAQTAMRVAQRLYENGYITYMRTDSTTLAGTAIEAARAQVSELYGADHVSEKPRSWAKKVKNAQEAHEAIRPAGDSFRTPGELAGELSPDEQKLYELIWKRTLASQMSDARGTTMTVRFGNVASDGRDAEFSATGTVITHRGFLAVYEEGRDADSDADAVDEDERRLPPLSEGDSVTALELQPEGHSTNPPARYTEASLVKALEERGIGRPSTYAATISTIVDRGYVFKRGTALVPSFLAFSVVALLERHFADLVDYGFTARMEEILDLVAAGDTPRQRVLEGFYFGDAGREFPGLHPLVSNLGEIDAREVNSMPLGESIVLRVGRYGPYVQRGDGDEAQRANVPHDMTPEELTLEKAKELLSAPSGDRDLGVHPETGRLLIAKSGRYGPYVTEVLPDDVPKSGKKAVKPHTASLLSTMTLDTVTLDDAVRLMSLPRAVGSDPADGQEITAQNGRYGPYLKKGTDSRSLASEDQIFSVTLDEALAIYAQPKQRGRRAAPPLRDLGSDPVTGKQVLVKEGRFGPYVTDGETNATLRRTDVPETVTIERAAELLADKRAQGPAPAGRAGKRAAKKTTKKTTKKAVKKTAKKAAKTAATGSAPASNSAPT